MNSGFIQGKQVSFLSLQAGFKLGLPFYMGDVAVAVFDQMARRLICTHQIIRKDTGYFLPRHFPVEHHQGQADVQNMRDEYVITGILTHEHNTVEAPAIHLLITLEIVYSLQCEPVLAFDHTIYTADRFEQKAWRGPGFKG